MKVGVIIIFHNNAEAINSKRLVKIIKASEHIVMCFVDNESRDSTLEKLSEVKEACFDKVSIVEIKKKVSQEAAKRAGARSMFNDFDLKHIGFLDANVLTDYDYDFDNILSALIENKDGIIQFDKEIKNRQRIKPTLLKSIFSILDYFKSQDFLNNNNIQQTML